MGHSVKHSLNSKGHSAWSNTEGKIAHPDSPAGSAGPGSFAIPGHQMLTSESTLPHPDSPACRTVNPLRVRASRDRVHAMSRLNRKPPPIVYAAHTQIINGIKVVIKKDLHNVMGVSGAVTNIHPLPGEFQIRSDSNGKIISFSRPHIGFEIQTSYGTGNPMSPSGYGRGTTEKDVKQGNTSLAFHESRHQKAYIGKLRSKKLPQFMGKEGMDATEFDSEIEAWNSAIESYLKAIVSEANDAVDEVGYKRSEFCQLHPLDGVCD